jgi:hypothetical protein
MRSFFESLEPSDDELEFEDEEIALLPEDDDDPLDDEELRLRFFNRDSFLAGASFFYGFAGGSTYFYSSF